jgi:hypothetical protein
MPTQETKAPLATSRRWSPQTYIENRLLYEDSARSQQLFKIYSNYLGVGIATGYGLKDRGVGIRGKVGSRIFSSPRRPETVQPDRDPQKRPKLHFSLTSICRGCVNLFFLEVAVSQSLVSPSVILICCEVSLKHTDSELSLNLYRGGSAQLIFFHIFLSEYGNRTSFRNIAALIN